MIEINKEKLIEIYQSDKSMDEVAKYFNVSKSTIRNKIVDYKITTKLLKHEKPKNGDKFNRLTFCEFIEGDKECKFICDCGNELITTLYPVITNKTKSCGCYKKEKASQSLWKGHGEIGKKFWGDLIRNAAKRKIDFNLTIEYAWDLFLKQEKKCVLSEEPLCFKRGIKENNLSASLDRIDSSKGYIKGNVQWVGKEINYMKRDLSENEFMYICKVITENNNNG